MGPFRCESNRFSVNRSVHHASLVSSAFYYQKTVALKISTRIAMRQIHPSFRGWGVQLSVQAACLLILLLTVFHTLFHLLGICVVAEATVDPRPRFKQ